MLFIQGDRIKHIFTYKNRYYGYKVWGDNVENHEILEDYDNIDKEMIREEQKITAEEWKYIFEHYEELEQESEL